MAKRVDQIHLRLSKERKEELKKLTDKLDITITQLVEESIACYVKKLKRDKAI